MVTRYQGLYRDLRSQLGEYDATGKLGKHLTTNDDEASFNPSVLEHCDVSIQI